MELFSSVQICDEVRFFRVDMSYQADVKGVTLKQPLVNSPLCQELLGACKGSSESLGSPRSLCSECQEGRMRCSDAWVPSFNVRPSLQAGYSFEHFVPSSE